MLHNHINIKISYAYKSKVMSCENDTSCQNATSRGNSTSCLEEIS